MNLSDIHLHRLTSFESALIQHIRTIPQAQQDMLMAMAENLAHEQVIPDNVIPLLNRA